MFSIITTQLSERDIQAIIELLRGLHLPFSGHGWRQSSNRQSRIAICVKETRMSWWLRQAYWSLSPFLSWRGRMSLWISSNDCPRAEASQQSWWWWTATLTNFIPLQHPFTAPKVVKVLSKKFLSLYGFSKTIWVIVTAYSLMPSELNSSYYKETLID